MRRIFNKEKQNVIQRQPSDFINERTKDDAFADLSRQTNDLSKIEHLEKLKGKSTALLGARGILTKEEYELKSGEILGEINMFVESHINEPPPPFKAFDGFEPTRYKILILSANPIDGPPVRTEKEIKEITKKHQQSTYRDQFEILDSLATSEADLRDSLLKSNPHIVHFIGHGVKAGIFLLDKDDKAKIYDNELLRDVLSYYRNKVHCVFFNSCFSTAQAKYLQDVFQFVVGMNFSVEVETAIKFSTAFYEALFELKEVSECFSWAKGAINADKLPGIDIPRLIESKPKQKEQIITTKQIKSVFGLDDNENLLASVMYHLGTEKWKWRYTGRLRELTGCSDADLKELCLKHPGVITRKIIIGSDEVFIGFSNQAEKIWNAKF